MTHIPVLLEQSIAALEIKSNGIYVDATFGRGGHSRLILEKLGPKGKLFVIDQDPSALECAKQLAEKDSRVIVCSGNFKDIKSLVSNKIFDDESNSQLDGMVDGILFDLGVSSPQLDQAERGFSFHKDGPLDMRMDNSSQSNCLFTAEQWLAKASESEIADVLWNYGEEKYSRKIARAIVNARAMQALKSTAQLAEIIKQAHPNWPKNKHPATQSFLAIRLFINQELEVTKSALKQAVEILKSDGKLVVITFHSLEDRIVKNFFKANSNKGLSANSNSSINSILDKLPLTDQELANIYQQQKPLLKHVQKPIKAGIIEGDVNIRARSAVLRIATKI